MWNITITDHNPKPEETTVYFYDNIFILEREYKKLLAIQNKYIKKYSFSIEVNHDIKINQSIELNTTLFLSE